MYLKPHLKPPQMTGISLGKTTTLSSIPSWPSNPTTISDPLQTISLTQTLPNPIIPQTTRPLGPGLLISLFFILIMSAFCVIMLLFFLLPALVDHWEEWLDGRRNGDWRRRRKVGERRGLCKRKNACGAGAIVLEYGGCVFDGKAGGLLGKGGDVSFDLERGDCCENGDKEAEGKGECEGRRCRNGKIVRFVEEVEIVEFKDGDIVMLVVWDEERKRTVGLKRGCEIS